MSEQETPTPQPVTVRVPASEDPTFAAERPIDALNRGLQLAVDKYTKDLPVGPIYSVTVHIGAKVKRTNPGAYDEYVISLIPD